jgi:hypothetical protein
MDVYAVWPKFERLSDDEVLSEVNGHSIQHKVRRGVDRATLLQYLMHLIGQGERSEKLTEFANFTGVDQSWWTSGNAIAHSVNFSLPPTTTTVDVGEPIEFDIAALEDEEESEVHEEEEEDDTLPVASEPPALYPIHLGGPWYRTSDGQSVRGEKAALEAQIALDEEAGYDSDV